MVRAQGLQLASLPLGKVPLYGVVYERLADEPEQFARAAGGGDGGAVRMLLAEPPSPFFPLPSRGALGLLRLPFLGNLFRALARGDAPSGNMVGDYSMAGGVLVVGPGDRGIQYQSLESDFGDLVRTAVPPPRPQRLIAPRRPTWTK